MSGHQLALERRGGFPNLRGDLPIGQRLAHAVLDQRLQAGLIADVCDEAICDAVNDQRIDSPCVHDGHCPIGKAARANEGVICVVGQQRHEHRHARKRGQNGR